MTRETKIGLLVGLAFIIVIGILLSDHLTSSTEPPQAPLVQAGSNVRSGVTVPGSGAAAASNPPITTVSPQAQQVAPQQQVPTREEVSPRQPPVEIGQIGGAAAQPPAPTQAPAGEQNGSAVEQGVESTDSNSPPVARPVDSNAPGSLA